MPTPTRSHALLQVTGADAADFLHAQLTVDVHGLGTHRHALAAWCDAQGRALCLLRIIPAGDGYLLLLPADLAAAISQRLRMYVLRARVDISPVDADWRIAGLTDSNASLPGDGELARDDDRILLGWNTGSGLHALTIGPQAATDAALPVEAEAWQLAEIDAGLPEILAPTSAMFVPQMLNLHWLRAIAFNKGCYPGQEIVARLQYRGRLKRRLFRLEWQGQRPQAGDEVQDVDGRKQGTVIRAAGCDAQAGRLLAVVQIAAAEQPLSTTWARLTLLDLPYETDGS